MSSVSGLLLGLLAAGMWGSLDVIVAFMGRRVTGVASAAGVVGTSCLVILAAGVTTGVSLPTDPRTIALAAAAGAISSIGFACFYTALRLGPVTVVSPIVAAYGGMASFLAVVFLGERIGPQQAAGVVVATAGIALAGVVVARGDRRPRFTGPGVPFALVSLVAWSVSVVVLAEPIRQVGWLSAATIARPSNALLLFAALFVVRRRAAGAAEEVPALAPEPEPPFVVPARAEVEGEPAGAGKRPGRDGILRIAAILAIGGLLESAGYVAFTYGLEVAPAWLVSLASSMGPVVTVSAGIALLGERPGRVQWLGIGLVAAGIALVASG